jgi:hypothetical protein
MTIALPRGASGAAAAPAAPPVAIIVDAEGISPLTLGAAARERLAASEFYWLDLFGGDDSERKSLLMQLGLEDADVIWVQRFGQAAAW